MSKNIKFRVWNKATKTMHLPDWYELAIRANLPEMELMQFTGLFDKNRKEIFKDDIIKIHNNGEHTKKEYWFPIFQVINDGFTFCLKYISGGKKGDSSQFTFRYHSKTDVEVIGNIYQNPKLIKK